MKSTPLFQFALREDLKGNPEFLPTKIESSDTGWDVRCADRDGALFNGFEHKLISLGIRMFAPKGWWLELRPRSSSHAKKHLHCLYGVIDEGYEKELQFSCQLIASDYLPTPLYIPFGERIGQVIPVERQSMVVLPVDNEEFDRLCKERGGQRGTGGFGSSGDK